MSIVSCYSFWRYAQIVPDKRMIPVYYYYYYYGMRLKKYCLWSLGRGQTDGIRYRMWIIAIIIAMNYYTTDTDRRSDVRT